MKRPFNLKVIVGTLVIASFILMTLVPSMASPVPEDISVTDFPYLVYMGVMQTSSSSSTFTRVGVYRDGNDFYLPTAPYIRDVRFDFTFSDLTQFDTSMAQGLARPGVSPGAVTTMLPYDFGYTLPVQINNFDISLTFYETYTDASGTHDVVSNLILETSPERGFATIRLFDDTGHPVYTSTTAQSNPFDFYEVFAEPVTANILRLNFRFKGYPSAGVFNPSIRVHVNQIVINGYALREQQIILDINNKLDSLNELYSDINEGLAMPTPDPDVVTNVVNNYIDLYDENQDLKDFFQSLYGGVGGVSIISPMITLSLAISLLAFILFGRSGG